MSWQEEVHQEEKMESSRNTVEEYRQKRIYFENIKDGVYQQRSEMKKIIHEEEEAHFSLLQLLNKIASTESDRQVAAYIEDVYNVVKKTWYDITSQSEYNLEQINKMCSYIDDTLDKMESDYKKTCMEDMVSSDISEQ